KCRIMLALEETISKPAAIMHGIHSRLAYLYKCIGSCGCAKIIMDKSAVRVKKQKAWVHLELILAGNIFPFALLHVHLVENKIRVVKISRLFLGEYIPDHEFAPSAPICIAVYCKEFIFLF